MDEFFFQLYEFFFQLYASPRVISSFYEEALMANQSAFQAYTHQPCEGLTRIDHQNANKRMVEFLKQSTQIDRSHKHKISERIRREKHKRNFLALHKLLPIGTKSDRKSILETAAKEIEGLKECKEELERRNREMEMILEAGKCEKAVVEKAEIELKVGYPASGIDSMLEVLRCLRDTGSTATGIQSTFSEHQLAAVLQVETKIRAADVEKAVQGSLFEAETKFRGQLLKECGIFDRGAPSKTPK